MCIKRQFITIILSLIGITSVCAQRNRTEICIDFRLGSHTIDPNYMDNAARLDEIMEAIGQLHRDTLMSVVQVVFTGVSSPEGNYQVNKRLAGQRLKSLEQYVRSHLDVSDELVVKHNDTYIPWNYLITEVENSDIAQKEEVLSILRGPSELIPYYNNTTIDSRIPALQKLDGGRVWRTLNNRFFAKMRNACAVLMTIKEEPLPVVVPAPVPVEVVDTVAVVVPEPEPAPAPAPQPLPEPEEWMRHIHLKTNAIGWGMLMANIAVEVDLAKHWSLTIPYYYSAWNYFTSTVKFRTSCLQPEVRYWLDEENKGWFGGAHLGLAWYNYAKGGDWRYQDHNRRTPLYGGGLSIGYRLPISKSHRWWMEFSVGGGVYKLHYDIFHNQRNGPLVDTRKRTFYGLDQASIAFAYRFDWTKKGGIR